MASTLYKWEETWHLLRVGFLKENLDANPVLFGESVVIKTWYIDASQVCQVKIRPRVYVTDAGMPVKQLTGGGQPKVSAAKDAPGVERESFDFTLPLSTTHRHTHPVWCIFSGRNHTCPECRGCGSIHITAEGTLMLSCAVQTMPSDARNARAAYCIYYRGAKRAVCLFSRRSGQLTFCSSFPSTNSKETDASGQRKRGEVSGGFHFSTKISC